MKKVASFFSKFRRRFDIENVRWVSTILDYRLEQHQVHFTPAHLVIGRRPRKSQKTSASTSKHHIKLKQCKSDSTEVLQ